MQALVITAKKHFEIRDIPEPVPAADEALIRLIGNTACNQHDEAVFNGRHSTRYPLENGFPGHEGVGRVEACGADVTGFAAGDLVVMTGYGGPPLYSELVTRKAGTFFKVTPPEGYDLQSLACLELYACVEHALRKVPAFDGKSVAVAGLGAAGCAALQLLKARGVDNAAGIDTNTERFDLARACGAFDLVDAVKYTPFTKLFTKALQAAAEGRALPTAEPGAVPNRRYDIVIECSGNPLSTVTSFALAREEVVMFGYCRSVIPVIQHFWFDTELTIRNAKQLDNADLKTVADLASAGRIDPARLITHRAKFRDYGKLMGHVRKGEVIKAVVTW